MNRDLSDVELLGMLVGFSSTSDTSNRGIAEFIADYLEAAGLRVELLPAISSRWPARKSLPTGVASCFRVTWTSFQQSKRVGSPIRSNSVRRTGAFTAVEPRT